MRRLFLEISVKLLFCGSDVIMELSERSWADESIAWLLNCARVNINL